MTASLIDWLRSRSAAQLGSLLRQRPEAITPPLPRNLTELADRLTTPHALAAALDRLPTPAIQVIEVLQLLGPEKADRRAVADWLGCGPDHPGLVDTLATLADLALVWPEQSPAQPLGIAEPLQRAFRFPLGLGPPAATLLSGCSAEQLRPIARKLGIASHGRRAELVAAVAARLCDPDAVRDLVAQAPPATRAALRELAESGPVTGERDGWYGYHAPDPSLTWATERGLVVTDNWGVPQLAQEAALALRGPDWHVPFAPYRPDPPLVEVSDEPVAREAAAAGGAAVEQLASLVASIDTQPVPLLKSGGIGVRELRRLARTTGLDEPTVRLWLELAYEAELVALTPTRGGGGELLPAPGYDRWIAAEPAERLAAVLPVWAVLPAAPLLGPLDESEKPGPALLQDQLGEFAARVRQCLLSLLSTLPPGRAVADENQLTPAVTWLAPLALSADPGVTGRAVAAAWQEARLLGVVAHGGYSPLGQALTSGDPDRLDKACRELLPAPVDAAVFQADLTALVPGVPERALAELLDAVADRESGGGAVTWRFHPGSVRRGLDAGHSPDQLLAALRERAVGRTLPQPLVYLVNDLARRHGSIRVRTVECVLRVPDEALATELAGARALRPLGLVRIAPTVLTAAVPADRALSTLRTAGYSPVAESDAGVPRLERPEPRRADPRPRRYPERPGARLPHDPLALAEKLLAAPDPEPPPGSDDEFPGAGPGGPDQDGTPGSDVAAELTQQAAHLTPGERRLLVHAIETQQPVTISYTNAQGNHSTRVIDTVELVGPHLVAWCWLREDERMFALHRINSVAPAQEP